MSTTRQNPEVPEGFNPEAPSDPCAIIMDYLRMQFLAAAQKEKAENEVEPAAPNGSFLVTVPNIGEMDNELIVNSKCIVMRLPYTRGTPDAVADFIEVYAVFLRGEDGHVVADSTGFFADQFIAREFESGEYSGFELITEDGVFPADLNGFDPESGFPELTDGEADSVDQQMSDLFRPFTRAQELYDKIKFYNIVATVD